MLIRLFPDHLLIAADSLSIVGCWFPTIPLTTLVYVFVWELVCLFCPRCVYLLCLFIGLPHFPSVCLRIWSAVLRVFVYTGCDLVLIPELLVFGFHYVTLLCWRINEQTSLMFIAINFLILLLPTYLCNVLYVDVIFQCCRRGYRVSGGMSSVVFFLSR